MASLAPRRLWLACAAALALAGLSQPIFAQATADQAAASANPQDPAAQAWGFAASDVPVDPDVRFGVLPNGMKYALRRNTTPRNTVLLRLRFDIGSLAEREDQRGLAHFLEHMAFNGSTHVAEGEMVPLLERNGLAFGADTNASTGFDETIYQLDLPRGSDDLVDLGLMLFRETASELTIAPEAVERERGVILSERRARDNFGLQNAIDQLAFLFPESIARNRLPIGLQSVIETVPASEIRAFYDAYYRPERATLVVVGDMDLDAMEAKVRARFADWQARAANGPEPELGRIDFARQPSADIFTHPAISESIDITWLKPWQAEADSLAIRRRDLTVSIGEAVLRRRLSRIVLQPDSPLSSANFGSSEAWDFFKSYGIVATARDGEWGAALALVENELRRARDFGFSAGEIAEQVAELRQQLRDAAASADTRPSAALAGQLLGVADGDSVATTPAFRAALFESLVPELTAERVSEAFRQSLAGADQPLIRVTTKQAIDGGEASLLAAYTAATQIALTPPAAQLAVEFSLASLGEFGASGTVVSDQRIEDLGIRQIRFANNVLLSIKRTDFQQNRVLMQVRVDGGNLLNTAEDPTRVTLASLLPLGGLQAYSVDQLQTVLAGRTVSPAFSAVTDSFSLSASTTPQDFELQAHLSAAMLRYPGYRPEAIDLFRRVIPQQYAANDATPAAVIARDLPAILADGDPRLVTPPLDRMLGLDWPALRTAIDDSLTNGAIEIGIVGDVDEAAAIAAIAATFGALPERRATFDPRTEARQRRFARDRATRTLIHRGDADQAIVQSFWPATDASDQPLAVRLNLLADIMGILLTDELRERLGETYSPSASANLSDDFPGYGYLAVASNVDVANIASVEATFSAVAARLRDMPITADLIDRARRPAIEALTRSRRENGYWLGITARAVSRPDRLERSRRALAELESVTAAELQQLAQRYLVEDQMLRVRVISDKAPAASTPQDDAAPSPAG